LQAAIQAGETDPMPRPLTLGTANRDWILLQNATEAQDVYAGADDDGVFGSAFADLLKGEAGNDQLYGEAGADTLQGEDGQDTIFGGDGNDSIDAGAGNDQVYGGAGNDIIVVGAGNDVAWGEDGNDRISTGTGDDTIQGGNGDDRVDGGAGHDYLQGDAGADTLLAGEGRNTVIGGEGNDSMTAGASADTLIGDSGNDSMNAGDGNNAVWGGVGNDSMVAGSGNDDMAGDDGNDTMRAGGGNDGVWGNGGNDSMALGAGNDRGSGDDGADTILGEDGNDSISAGEGDDVLSGGAGADRVSAAGGNDLLIHGGGAAGDIYDGGAGLDTLSFDLTRSEWMDSLFQTELTSLLARMARNPSANNVLTSQSLTVRNVEAVAVTVDGVTLTAADDGVTARNDAFSASEDAGLIGGSVLSNDSAPDLVARVELVSGPAAGLLALNADGSFSWTFGDAFQSLRDGETAGYSFTYRVVDADGDSATASVALTVTGANDGPLTQEDVAEAKEDAPITLDVLANDRDPEGEALELVEVTGSEYGAKVSIVDGRIVYDATGSEKLQSLNDGEAVKDVFTYVVRDASGGMAKQSAVVVVYGANEGEVLPPADTTEGGGETKGTLLSSFEGSDKLDWQRTGDVLRVEGGTEGKSSVRLSTADGNKEKELEGWTHVEKGTLDALGRGDVQEGSAIRTKLDLAAGQTLHVDWRFATEGEVEGNDIAFVVLRLNGQETVTLLGDVKSLDGKDDSGWQDFSFKVEKDGGYELAFGVADVDGTSGTSLLWIDNLWVA
jgi:hypothetical protein